MNGISHKREKRAIIDIGSNTVRLVVYNGPRRAPVVILNEKVSARLGRDLARSGTIPDKAMTAALAALERFAMILRLMDVTNVDCVATAAARDASNGPALLEAVRGFGLSPRLLSGEEEARASATGVIAAFPGARGVVADLGGGSLELVEVDSAVLPGGVTLPFGTLRLPDHRAGGPRKFADTVRAELKRARWSAGSGLPIYACGGSWRALALQAMREIDWPLDDPHGFDVPADQVLRLCQKLEKGKILDPDSRIGSARLATLPDAAALLGQVIVELKPSRIVFSSWGLREGLLFAQMPPDVQARDPLLSGVEDFAAAAFVSHAEGAAVAAWTAPVCDDSPQDGNLRLAATTLALAGMRTEPNMRTEEAMGWALRKRWVGLDARGRGMMAMTVFANSGLTTIPPEFLKLAEQADLDHAIGWGLAIRLCRRLTAGAPEALGKTAIRRDGAKLVLTLDPTVEALYANSVGKDLKALGEWLGLEWSVEVKSAP